MKKREEMSEETIKKLEERQEKRRKPAYKPFRDWGDSDGDLEAKNDNKNGGFPYGHNQY